MYAETRKERLTSQGCCRQLDKFIIVRDICLYNTLLWLVCNKPAGRCFPDCGVWLTVEIASKYKILWGETWAHGVPIPEEEKLVQKMST